MYIGRIIKGGDIALSSPGDVLLFSRGETGVVRRLGFTADPWRNSKNFRRQRSKGNDPSQAPKYMRGNLSQSGFNEYVFHTVDRLALFIIF